MKKKIQLGQKFQKAKKWLSSNNNKFISHSVPLNWTVLLMAGGGGQWWIIVDYGGKISNTKFTIVESPKTTMYICHSTAKSLITIITQNQNSTNQALIQHNMHKRKFKSIT